MIDFSIPVFDFTGHLGSINAICGTKNGHIIYSLEDQSIRIWDIAKKKMIHLLLSMNVKTEYLELSSDEKYLAAGDERGFIELWDLDKKIRISRIRAYSASLHKMSFAEDEETLITIGESDTYLLKKYKLDKKSKLTLVDEFDLEEKVLHSIITATNKSIITLTAKEMLFFKFKNLKLIHDFEHDGIEIINSSISRDALFGIDKNGLLRIWELKKLKVIYEMNVGIEDFKNGISHTALDTARGWLFFGNRTKLRIWDINQNQLVLELKAPKSKGKIDYLNCFDVDTIDAKLIIGGSEKLRIIDINTGKALQTIRRKPTSPPFYGNFSHSQLSKNKKFVVTIRKLIDKTETKEEIEIWNFQTGESNHKIFPEMDSNSNIKALEISPNSKFFVTGDDSKISNGTIWNLETGKIRKRLKELDYGVNSIIVSEDNSVIITSDEAFDIEMFDSKTGNYLKKISSGTKHVSSFALTKDNSTLVCAYRDVLDRDFDIEIWNIENDELIGRLSADIDWEDKISHVEFSPNEKEIFAISDFGHWIKWDTKSWKIKEKTLVSTHRLTERLNESIYTYPLAENIILRISNPDEITTPIVKFIKSWREKTKWISQSKDSFSLISEIPVEKGAELLQEIENMVNDQK